MTDTIAALVELLAVQDGRNRPLLVTLRRSIRGDIGMTVSGASKVTTLPINAGAYDLWKRVTEGTDEEVGLHDMATAGVGVKPSDSAVVNLLAWHAAFAAARDRGDITDDVVATHVARLTQWVNLIRDHFEPPLAVELTPFACPNCGSHRARWGAGELQTESAAIVVGLEDGELVARCRVAGCTHVDGRPSRWRGLPEIAYMARRGGIDVDQLTDAIREAMRPTPELPYDPEGHKKVVVTPEDPDYASARAEVS